ncbi:MAG: DUF3108 domain-containing protein, partial [Thermoanaerobaculia bacterium]
MRRVVLMAMLLTTSVASGQVREIFDAGETLDFNLSWTRVSGGAARMTISPIPNDRYRLTSVAKSGAFFSRIFKVRDEIESIVDRSDFSTLQYHKILDERGKKKDELTVIDEARGVAGGCGLWVAGCGLWVVGCGLWVVGCRLLVVGCWEGGTYNLQPTTV